MNSGVYHVSFSRESFDLETFHYVGKRQMHILSGRIISNAGLSFLYYWFYFIS